MSEPQKPLSSETRRQKVYDRARGRCEYCLTDETNTGQIMQIDHIDPNGGDSLDNLCLSCWSCNNYKRSATAAVDPETGKVFPLFNPRIHR
jgi:5-methylcytosine-specific restriction endonuclease McrA